MPVPEMDVISAEGVEGGALEECAEMARTSGSGPSPLGWRRRGVHLAVGLRAATWVTCRLPDPTRYWLADVGGNAAHILLRQRAAIAAENYLVFTQGNHRAAARLTRLAFDALRVDPAEVTRLQAPARIGTAGAASVVHLEDRAYAIIADAAEDGRVG